MEKRDKVVSVALNDIDTKLRFYRLLYGDVELDVHLERKKELFDRYLDVAHAKGKHMSHKRITL